MSRKDRSAICEVLLPGGMVLLAAAVAFGREIYLIVHRGGFAALSLSNLLTNEPYLLLWVTFLFAAPIYAYYKIRAGGIKDEKSEK